MSWSNPVAVLGQGWQRLLGRVFDRVYVSGGRYAVYDQTRYLRQHPTAAQRATGFDWTLYQVMADDRARVDAYRRDIETLVSHKSVLEIGTGPHALLTSIAAEAGAREILSVEANPWVAAEARRRVRRFDERVRILTGHTDDLSDELLDAPRHFDVLLIECYHAIASQEQVVETIASLRRRGITFDVVISRGFTTFVAPAGGPSSAPMTSLERLAMGWPAGRPAADAAMAERFSSLHGDLTAVALQRLTTPVRWQWCDLESDGRLHTAGTLRFSVERIENFAGLQFFNHFWFHHGQLDTGEVPTDWGVYFVPLTFDGALAGRNGRAELVLTTTNPVADQPSSVELTASVENFRTRSLRL